MPQFVVPQFIEVEDTIIGPITTRQFIMGVVVLLILFLMYRFADLALFIVEAVILLAFYAIIAFVRINGRPFYYFVLNILRSFKRPHLRLWGKENLTWRPEEAMAVAPHIAGPARRKIVDQELSALSLLLDTGGRYRPEEILIRNRGTEEPGNLRTKEQKNQETKENGKQ